MRSNSLFDEFKGAFQRPNNSHIQLIWINVVIFITLSVLWVFSKWFSLEGFFTIVYDQFSIPPTFAEFVTRPWTLVTYMFAHSLGDIFHILFNMLVFYWFARLIVEYLGSDRLTALYVLGGLAGGLAYLMVYNFIPFYESRSGAFTGMVGASAAVYAVTVAAATLLPNYSFHLIFFGPVKIKYIAAFYILISFIGSVGGNAGGNIAHLGGAAIGFLYIKQLNGGNDIGRWIIGTITFLKSFFVRQPKMKVHSNRSSSTSRRSSKNTGGSRVTVKKGSNINQDEIDAILDKISQSGYESLTTEEKQKLFNASKK